MRLQNWSFSRWLRQRCHWQNLNENRLHEVKGSIFWHGRAWFHRKWNDDTKHRNNIAVCWSVWTHFFGLRVDLCEGDSERDIGLFFGCGLFAIWITLENAFPKRLKDRIQFGSALRARIVHTISRVRHTQWEDRNDGGDLYAYQYGVLIDRVLAALIADDSSISSEQYDSEMARLFNDGYIQMRANSRNEFRVDTVYEKTTDYWSRGIGIEFHNGSVWFSLWKPDGHWSASEPKWWAFSFNPIDFLLGSHKHSKRIISTHTATVPMPEGSYPATVTILERTWKRPRWPFKKRQLSAEIEVEGGVPVPGKGENSWDCGEDAIMATGSNEPTVTGAVAAMVKSALHTRERHGGPNWKPEGCR